MIIKKILNYKKIILPVVTPVILFLLFNSLFPLPEDLIEKDYSTVYLDREGKLLRITLSPSDKYRFKLPLEKISPFVKSGIILYEDKYFYSHYGINPLSVFRAYFMNKLKGRIVSGASTITMQVARMIERKDRTYFSKMIEAFRALQLELKYSKKEILEIYLNLIPMGGNLEGIGAGAYFYFGKNAEELSLSESLLLIGLPKSPNSFRPDLHPKNAKRQSQSVLTSICKNLNIENPRANIIKSNNTRRKKFRNPFRCPHLVESNPGKNNLFFKKLTIDLNIQNFCENTFRRKYLENKTQKINNCAAIVIDNKNMEVLAYVGNNDFNDIQNEGKINCAKILRSPGSTLKPFLYSRAMDLGLVTPGTKIYDIPFHVEDYSPLNFNKSSAGPVSTRHALIHSLNIPAVRLEREMGNEGLSYILKKIFPLEREKQVDRSGLSLALGGFRLSLEELGCLYSSLARGGNYSKLKFLVNDNSYRAGNLNILSRESCYITSEMLSDAYRPDLPFNWEFSRHHAKIALKTGTSFGLRDAWCAAYTPGYTVVVWLGNANSSGSSFLIGVKKAAPYTISIMNFLTRNNDSWFIKPGNVKKRKVCVTSGEKLGINCKDYIYDYYIPGISSNKTCSIHKMIYIDKKKNYELCKYCMKKDSSITKKIIEEWPNEVSSFLKRTGKKVDIKPNHNPECSHFFNSDKPVIISPKNLSEYIIVKNLSDDKQKILLKAHLAQDSTEVIWMIKNKIIGRCKPDEDFMLGLERGTHIITALDSRGRSSNVTIFVK